MCVSSGCESFSRFDGAINNLAYPVSEQISATATFNVSSSRNVFHQIAFSIVIGFLTHAKTEVTFLSEKERILAVILSLNQSTATLSLNDT